MDQCTHCTSRGDYALCKATPCGKHEDWIVQHLRTRLASVEQEKATAEKERDDLRAEVDKMHVEHAELFHDLKAENERLADECKTLNEVYRRQLADQMELYQLRRDIHRIGERLIGEEMDEQDQVAVGGQLVELSRLCHSCGGTGEDGDPDGGTYACDSCKGKALIGQSPSEIIADLRAQLERERGERERNIKTLDGQIVRWRQSSNRHIAKLIRAKGELEQMKSNAAALEESCENWMDKCSDATAQLAAALEEVERLNRENRNLADRIQSGGIRIQLLTDQLAAAQLHEEGQYRAGQEWGVRWIKANWLSDWGKTIVGMEDAIRAEANQPAQGEGGTE